MRATLVVQPLRAAVVVNYLNNVDKNSFTLRMIHYARKKASI